MRLELTLNITMNGVLTAASSSDLLDVGAGYGYYRPHIQMFDPAWREDDTVGSRGKHPMAVIKRSAPQHITEARHRCLFCIYLGWQA